MLKCNINKSKNMVRVKANGTPHDLMVETATLIKDIHNHIHKESMVAASAYKMELIGMLLDPDSPVWKYE